MRGTKSLLLTLLLLVTLSITSTRITWSNPETTIYVDPPEVLGVPVGDSFDIYVTASYVEDLFLAEICLSWDPALLYTDTDAIDVGDVAPYLEFMMIEEVNNTEGSLHVVVGRPIGVKEGLNGTVQIAKITFLVEAEGSCALHFYDDPDIPGVEPRIKNSAGVDMDRTVEDGYFSNSPHDVAVTSVTPFPTTVTRGEPVTINVTAKNKGTETETFNVTAYNRGYLVLNPDGDGAYTDWEGDYTDWDDWPSIDTLSVGTTSGGKHESSTLADHTAETWPIEKVIVNIMAQNKKSPAPDEQVRLMLVIGGAMYDGSAHVPSNVTFTRYTSEWTTNPATSSPWTWSDIDALEAGVASVQVGPEWTGKLEVTQLYVEVIGAWQQAASPQTVTDLAPRASKNLTFTWDTTAFAGGTYTIKAEAEEVPDEENTANNVREADEKVTIRIHDIAITSVAAQPTKVIAGDRVTIKVTVVNKGNVPETFNVSVYYDTALIENKTITDLGAGDKLEPKIDWITTGVAEGNYTIKAEVQVPDDINTTNNVKEADEKVTVSLHDIEVTSVTASTSLVVIGDPVEIDVTVKNEGAVTETFDVSVYYDSELIETQTVTDLANGTYKLLTFTWDTAGVAEGTYTIKAEVPPVPGEFDTDDNTLTDGKVTVKAELVHDVAVTNVTASPTEVEVGGSVSVSVTVENQGDFIETFNVTAYYNDTIINETRTVVLGPKASTIITFTWNTTGVSPGAYTIKANATVVEDETDTADNTFTDGTVTVLTHDIAVTDVSASPTEVEVGGSVSVSVTVENQGGFTETFTVTVYANATLIDSRSVTLTSGDSATETFTWDTSGFATGDYVIKAEASAVQNETDTADNTFEGDTVTVNEVTGPGILLYAVGGIVVAAVAATILIYFSRVRKRKPT